MFRRTAKCLVTGGAGFIGSRVCERFLQDGHQVRVLDVFSPENERKLFPFKLIWRCSTANPVLEQAVNLDGTLRLVEKLNVVLCVSITPEYRPTQPGDLRLSVADISSAKNRLEYVPSVNLASGLH